MFPFALDRSAGTFSNYLSSLNWGCQLLGVEAPALQDPVLKRAKSALLKEGSKPRRGFVHTKQ